jgi:hypothetical protein
LEPFLVCAYDLADKTKLVYENCGVTPQHQMEADGKYLWETFMKSIAVDTGNRGGYS